MQRYDIAEYDDSRINPQRMLDEFPLGRYVRYADHESAITEARKQERLSCSSELWQEAQRLRRAGMLNDAYEYEQAAKLIAKDDFPKGLTQ